MKVRISDTEFILRTQNSGSIGYAYNYSGTDPCSEVAYNFVFKQWNMCKRIKPVYPASQYLPTTAVKNKGKASSNAGNASISCFLVQLSEFPFSLLAIDLRLSWLGWSLPFV
jgi:hypothetical protein